MKIVVTSDTHIKEIQTKRKLPKQLIDECASANMIIHAGDFQSIEVYEELNRYAPVKGVYGNVDSEKTREKLPAKQIIHADLFKIGVVHGHGQYKTTEKRAIKAFEDVKDLDIIVFGHSHIAYMRYVGNTLLLNPGSPTDKRKSPYHSYAILHFNGESMSCEFIYFK